MANVRRFWISSVMFTKAVNHSNDSNANKTWISLGWKHWLGTKPTTAITHIAIQKQLDGKAGFLFHAKTSPLFVPVFA